MITWMNLDAEYVWRHGSSWRRPRLIGRLCQRWRHLLRALPGALGAQAQGGAQLEGVRPDQPVVSWAVDARLIEALGPELARHLPDPRDVAAVNDKRLGLDLCCAHGIDQLDGIARVRELPELEAAIGRLEHPWLLKHPLGVGGRERVGGPLGRLPERLGRWAKARFRDGDELILEPRVELDGELSLHAEITPAGQVRWCGATQIWVAGHGTPRGWSHPLPMWAEQKRARRWRAKLEPALGELRARGYWGPVSVDGFWGRLGGADVERPLSEINARYTFGRLAMELDRWVPFGAGYTFELGGTGEDVPAHQGRIDVGSPRAGTFRLPEALDPGPEPRCWLELWPA